MNENTGRNGVKYFPEDTFLESAITIDPVEMSRMIIERTRGIVGTLREGAMADATYHPPLLASAMDQVEGNLDYLEKVLEYWLEEDRKVPGKMAV